LQRRLQSVEARIDAMNETARQQKISELDKLVEQLDGQLTDVGLELESCTLSAPYAGQIAKRYINQGAVVSAGMPIVRLVDTDSLQVWLGIPDAVATEIEVGNTYNMMINDRSYAGEATSKLPEIDRTTRSRTVIFQLPAGLSDEVLPGDLARVEIPRTIEGRGVWLPLTALMREAQGLWSVYVVKPRNSQGEARFVSRRYVEITHLEDARALVRGTLDDGELVITNGTHRVVPGQQVQYKVVELEPVRSGSQMP
jgi:RND family efflux transporter MFP subunit